jgi:hypothetical protein
MPKGVKFKEEVWFREAADIMVKERINLRRAAEQLGQVLLPEEANSIFRRKLFQVILQQAKNDFYAELGKDQNRTRDILIGRMLDAIDRLADEGQAKDVTLAAFQLSKILGFVGAETEVNVMGSLTQEDIDKLKNEIRTRRELLDKKPSNDSPIN